MLLLVNIFYLYTCWDWDVIVKLAIISHGKTMIRFESTTSLLRRLTKISLGFSGDCVIEDTLINFWGVILIEKEPKRRILCVREKPCIHVYGKTHLNSIGNGAVFWPLMGPENTKKNR